MQITQRILRVLETRCEDSPIGQLNEDTRRQAFLEITYTEKGRGLLHPSVRAMAISWCLTPSTLVGI